MNRRTHAWIAVRAAALLEEKGEVPGLVDEVLKPHVRRAAIGSWIPDMTDAKRSGSNLPENHVLKMRPFGSARYAVDKDETLRNLGTGRSLTELLRADQSLTPAWWGTPFLGDVRRPGQHIANRAMALSTTLADLLMMSNSDLIPDEADFIPDMPPAACTSSEQAAVYFFMLSHFLADACQPCHSDARNLSDYDKGLHKEIERHWATRLGTKLERKLSDEAATADAVFAAARGADGPLGLAFGDVPAVGAKDLWQEVINVCRGSFALASIMVPVEEYPYDDGDARAPFDDLFGSRTSELERFDAVILHDAVVTVAAAWKDGWTHAWRE